METAQKQFLVIQAARFGDLVQTKRLILSLEQYGFVHLLVDSNLKNLAAKLYPKTQVHSISFHMAPDTHPLTHFKETLETLQAISFTTIYNCNFSPLTAAVCTAFERKRVVGYRPYAGSIVKAPHLATIARITQFRSSACCNIEDVWAHLVQNPIAPQAVNPKPKPGKRGLGVVVAGQQTRRSLPPALFANILRVYANTLDNPPLYFFGTEHEKKSAYSLRREMAPALQKNIIDLCGKTSWGDLIDALEGLDYLLTPDTGTMHLAAHLGVPVHAFFLSSASCHETGPYGEGHTIWQAAPPCHPCLEQAPCTQNMICLEQMNERTFLRTLANTLNKKTNETLPPYLQHYQTGFDELGCICTLLEGSDPKQNLRAAEREWLRKQILQTGSPLDTPYSITSPLTQEEKTILSHIFVEDADWMLDQNRYK